MNSTTSTNLTVPQLKALCRDNGITKYSKLKKAELINILTTNNITLEGIQLPTRGNLRKQTLSEDEKLVVSMIRDTTINMDAIITEIDRIRQQIQVVQSTAVLMVAAAIASDPKDIFDDSVPIPKNQKKLKKLISEYNKTERNPAHKVKGYSKMKTPELTETIIKIRLNMRERQQRAQELDEMERLYNDANTYENYTSPPQQSTSASVPLHWSYGHTKKELIEYIGRMNASCGTAIYRYSRLTLDKLRQLLESKISNQMWEEEILPTLAEEDFQQDEEQEQEDDEDMILQSEDSISNPIVESQENIDRLNEAWNPRHWTIPMLKKFNNALTARHLDCKLQGISRLNKEEIINRLREKINSWMGLVDIILDMEEADVDMSETIPTHLIQETNTTNTTTTTTTTTDFYEPTITPAIIDLDKYITTYEQLGDHENCVVCLGGHKHDDTEDPPVKIPCGHVFHKGCLSGWFAQSEECPNCRCKYNHPEGKYDEVKDLKKISPYGCDWFGRDEPKRPKNPKNLTVEIPPTTGIMGVPVNDEVPKIRGTLRCLKFPEIEEVVKQIENFEDEDDVESDDEGDVSTPVF